MLVEIDGKKLELRNLKKELWPGIRKADLIEYYRLVWPLAKPFLDRPLALSRFPDGIRGEGFFQKDVSGIKPEWLETYKYYSESEERVIEWPVARDLASLVWLGELASLEIHMTLARDFKNPDIIAFDLDPEPPAGIDEAREIAFEIKDALKELEIKAFPKFSGKRGIHILLSVNNASFELTRLFARAIGKIVSKRNELAIGDWIPHKDRKGKVFIDYLQNAKQKTIVCPYSPRATMNATVSIPLDWKDLKKARPEDYTIKNSLEWIKRKDPWEDFWENPLNMARFKLER